MQIRSRAAATRIGLPVDCSIFVTAFARQYSQTDMQLPSIFRRIRMSVLAFCGLAFAAYSSAQSIPQPRNTPYIGTLSVEVDLTDLDRKIMQVRQIMPVAAGPLTLLYPQWLPGAHSPRGRVSRLSGLQITADGKPLAWTRDPLDVFAFHLTVPPGVTSLNVVFQHLSPVTGATDRVVMTPEIVGLQWNTVVLYPAGHLASAITVRPSAKLPTDWKIASALDLVKRDAMRTGDWYEFKPVSLETLVDSPLWAGKHFKRIELDTQNRAPVYLNVFADTPSQLEAAPEHVQAHQALVAQADFVFGSRHFARYEFLLSISDTFGGIGLEHAESSENGVRPGYFIDWKKTSAGRTLLPHEYVHSWVGKFRRPADLWTPHFNVPMQDSLLWIYEGQTQYWGHVLATRSGIVPLADSMGSLAATAAALNGRSGRVWRSLQDTTHEPVISQRARQDWPDWQRREDYYDEGLLIWLDTDTKIRELTAEAKSLDHVARNFFGVEDGRVATLTFTFDDYVRALNSVAPFDWASFLRERLDAKTPARVLDGIMRAGWKLVFTDVQSDYAKGVEAAYRFNDFSYSLGFSLDRDGKFNRIQWEGPAFKVGVTEAMQLIAVNGMSYKADDLRTAVKDAKDGRGVELLVKTGERYKTVKIDYRDGLRYPKLERVEGTPDRLTSVLSAVK